MKLGLCLAGGGVKGAAHIGVIKALEEENIKPDCLSGASAGSIVATLYAMGYTPEEMLELFKTYGKQITKIDFFIIIKIILGLIFTGKLCVEGLNSGNKLGKLIQKQADKKYIDLIKDIKMPLLIPSVNLYNGSIYLFSSQENSRMYSDEIKIINNVKIGKAVQASCAYPGVFCPTNLLGTKLIDGGIRENIPWKELKEIGANKIITVAFSKNKKVKQDVNIIDCITGSIGIMMHELYNCEIEGIEYLLNVKTENIGLLETDKIEELYNIGYEVAKREMEGIKEYLKK